MPAAAVASEVAKGPNITVLVFNFRQVPISVLVRAEKEAARILQQAGVHVDWRDCPTGNEPCRIGPGRVMFLAMSAGRGQKNFEDTISGYALPHDKLAVVFYDDLPSMPRDEKNEPHIALLLGCVITHELGHLLLGGNHSVGGIMQAQWGVEQVQSALMSQLTFLPEQVSLMQSGKAGPIAPNSLPTALKSH
jgi:hypothetical protein